jgi:hypothetical protein
MSNNSGEEILMADQNRQQWNQQFKVLQDTWPKPTNFENCIKLCMNIHAMVHTAAMSNAGLWSFEDELWEGMSEQAFRKFHKGDQSIAWKLWHIARIEDITMNMLIAGEPQIVSTGNWLEKMGITARDTGNAMNEEEIDALSKSIDMQALREYRLSVGSKTRSIIESLKPEDLKKKVEAFRLQRILDEGAVVEEARGIIDYWGKKTYAGLLLMPATRHNFVHLNESIRLLVREKTGREAGL